MPKSKESKPKDDTAQQPAQEEKPAANVEAEKQSKESTAESEGDEDSDEELEPGSLEKPIEILDRKSRERKSVSRFSTETVDSARKRPNLDYSAGKGTKLGEIEFVNWNIDNTPADDLKPLHRLLFRKAGKTVMVKRNIRQFCGFPFEKGTTLYAGMTKLVDRFTVAGLRFVAGILGTKKSQDKEEMKDSLVEFLMEPKDLGKEIPKRDEKKGDEGTTNSDEADDSTSVLDASGEQESEDDEEKAKDDEEEEEEEEAKDDDVDQSLNSSFRISWTPELCVDVYNCYLRARSTSVNGYTKRLKTFWDEMHPEFDTFDEKRLRSQAVFIDQNRLRADIDRSKLASITLADLARLGSSRDYSVHFDWTPELNVDVYNCYLRAKISGEYGYTKRMREFWTALHPECAHFTDKQLRTQAVFVEKRKLKSGRRQVAFVTLSDLKGTPAKSKSPQKKPGKKASKKPADGASGSDASEASAGESGGEADGEKADEDKSGEEKAHEGETKKKKSKPTPVKIAPRKKDKPQASPKKPAKKAQKNERKRKESESEDDEPLSSKKPKKEPTDDEVRKVIKEILKDADLEQVTMKTVCKQIYDHYPDCDMTSRKDFIKATVKEIIS